MENVGGVEDNDDAIAELENILFNIKDGCPICLEDAAMADLLVLSCLHVLCRNCIDGMCEVTAPGTPFHCPFCQSDISVPCGGSNEFISVENLRHSHSGVTSTNRVRRVTQTGGEFSELTGE